MLNEQMNLLYPVLAVFLVMTVFVLYVYFTSDRHFRLKLLLAPALLAACVFTVPAVGARLGYAWPTPLPASFQYIAHRTVAVEGEKRWIDVLLLSRRPIVKDARLHRIPWTKEMEGVLDEAGRMKEGPEGGDIVVNGRAGGAGKDKGEPQYSTTRVLPQDLTPKVPPSLPRQEPRPVPRHDLVV